jgi:hypothetical protein
MSQEERSIFWEVTISVILSKKVYMYMCPIPNGFRDRAISLYSTLYTSRVLLIQYLSVYHSFLDTITNYEKGPQRAPEGLIPVLLVSSTEGGGHFDNVRL